VDAPGGQKEHTVGLLRARGAARRTAAVLSVGAISALGLTAVTGTAVAANAANVTLPAEVVPGLASMDTTGAIPAATTMTVGVSMDVMTAARQAAYSALFTKGSPTYHDFYTPASFEQAFGVDQAAARYVHSWATRDGLKVVYANADGSYLELTGPASAVDATFKVTEKGYRNTGVATEDVAAHQAFVANDVAPTVPSSVSGVAGLNSLMTYSTAAATPSATDCVAGLSECLGALTPSDVRSVYGVPASDQGAGQKIAIFGEGELATVVKELRGFESTYDQPQVPVKEILVGDPLTDSSGDTEWELDSQATTGMAPRLQELDFYFGSGLSDPSITATYFAWVDDPNGPLTGNSSFGGAEQLESLDGFPEDAALMQADMEGRTMFVSAGDVGGSCLPGANGVTNTGVPCVEYPASSSYVNAVGGTILYTAASGSAETTPATRADEYSWEYSGGGVSDFEKAPSWQPAAFPVAGATTPPGLDAPGACAATSTCMRGVPDVSALSGDIVTNGYAYYTNGAVSEEGGTSLSSPLWAGMWANVQAAFTPTTACATAGDVSAESAKATSAGYAPPDLYAIAANATADAASFFNVGGTTDSMPSTNGQQDTNVRNAATDPTGYSFVAGLGSPELTGLIGNVDCGNTAAVTPDVPEAIGPAVYTYGVTPPYGSLSADGCTTNGQAMASASPPPTATGPYDLLSADLTSDSASTTFATTVATLTGSTVADYDYAFEFTFGADQYAVTVDTGASPSAELYLLTTTSTPIGLGVQADPTPLVALTPVIDTTTNTVSVALPFATFNSYSGQTGTTYGPGSQLSQLSVFSNSGPAVAALDNDFNVDPLDEINFYQCPYVVPGGAGTTPPASTPEAPLALLLPLAAFAAGGWVLRRRHQRSTLV
jgi:subtilase family serine protease